MRRTLVKAVIAVIALVVIFECTKLFRSGRGLSATRGALSDGDSEAESGTAIIEVHAASIREAVLNLEQAEADGAKPGRIEHKHCIVCENEDTRSEASIRIPGLLLDTEDAADSYEACRKYNPGLSPMLGDLRASVQRIIDEENVSLKRNQMDVLNALHELASLKLRSGEYAVEGVDETLALDDLGGRGLEVWGITPSGESMSWFANPGDWAPLDVAVEEGWMGLENARARIAEQFRQVSEKD